MRYHVLATDYDGTLAHDGRVGGTTLDALHRYLATGRRLVMVTGRELPELLEVFPQIELFEWVVAENGGLLYRPSTKEERPLAEPPPTKFVETLQDRGVKPLSVGRVIVATWQPHETAVLETIRNLGLELQVIFNKGAVMILPASVNKAFGLTAALKEMGISAHNAVGVGDAENDHAFLRMCEFSVAVANALPSLKETVDLTTERDHGGGVSELIDRMIEHDLKHFDGRLDRHNLALGTHDEDEVRLPSYGSNILICGPSGSGKSKVAMRVVESLLEQRYQFCVMDPEGDFEEFEGAVVLGGPKGIPQADEVLHLLENPEANAVVCLTGMPIPDRPPFFLSLLSNLLQMRSRTGRPHWLVMDEAHHLMPAQWLPPQGLIPDTLHNTLLITLYPHLLARAMLERINLVAAVGDQAQQTLEDFARLTKIDSPRAEDASLDKGELLLWSRERGSAPTRVRVYPSKIEHRRHHRKYAEGELPVDECFYFHGPEGKLNLRAQNLTLFLQLAEGVDDVTWQFHLRRGDYSRWFRQVIKDDALAEAAARVEQQSKLSAQESREQIRAAIEAEYVLSPTSPLPVPAAR